MTKVGSDKDGTKVREQTWLVGWKIWSRPERLKNGTIVKKCERSQKSGKVKICDEYQRVWPVSHVILSALYHDKDDDDDEDEIKTCQQQAACGTLAIQGHQWSRRQPNNPGFIFLPFNIDLIQWLLCPTIQFTGSNVRPLISKTPTTDKLEGQIFANKN